MMVQAAARTWRLPRRERVTAGEVAFDLIGHGPPVVLVHGTPAWSYLWRDVAPILADRFTVYVLDLLGFGDSRVGSGSTPSIPQQAQTLAELIERWHLDRPALVGHDVGGSVVLRAHVIDGVSVHRLALLDAAVLGPWNTAFTEHMQQHHDVYRTMPPHVFADIIAARMRTATHRPMTDEAARSYLEPWAGPDGQQRWIDQVTRIDHEDTRDVVARLDRIAAKTLVLWGANDTWLDPATGQRLAAAIPGARMRTISGAGHFLPEDCPKDTAHALMEHLS